MFIKRTKRTLRGKIYTNHLLVESVATERGPRHRVVCSLGSLSPGPKAQWLKLAHHLQQSLSGQESLLDDSPQEQVALQKPEVAARGPKKHQSGSDVNRDEVEVEQARQAGAVHVGHQYWQRLGLDEILAGAGFGLKTRILTQVMTLNRLIQPCSELAMSNWVRRSALEDILKENFSRLNEDRLYRNMDRLYGKRVPIEAALREKERTLFSLKERHPALRSELDLFRRSLLVQCQGPARLFAPFPTRLQTSSRRAGVSTETGSPKPMRSSPAIAVTRPPLLTCSGYWKSAWVKRRMPPLSWTGAWQTRRTSRPSARQAITGWRPPLTRVSLLF